MPSCGGGPLFLGHLQGHFVSFRIPILSVALTIVATAPIWLVGYIVRPNLWETDDGSPHLFRTLVMLEAQSRYLGFPR